MEIRNATPFYRARFSARLPMELTPDPAAGRRDALLAVVGWILTIMLWLSALAAIVALCLIPLSYSRKEEAGLQLVAQHFPTIAAMLLLAAVAATLGFFFIRHLRRIVDSVAVGDPFAPANADRLSAMAWLTLAYQGVQILLAPLLIWWDAAPMRANVHHGGDGLSLATIVLAMILFILARVFRHGAAMREDLEGTV